MGDANLKAVDLIVGELKKQVKCFAQITRSGPSSHALSDPSRRLQKAMNKLVRAERIQLLASLLAKLRTEIPPENLKRIEATLHRLYRQSPPDESELAPRETLRALIQELSLTPPGPLTKPTISLNQGRWKSSETRVCKHAGETAGFCATCGKLLGGF